MLGSLKILIYGARPSFFYNLKMRFKDRLTEGPVFPLLKANTTPADSLCGQPIWHAIVEMTGLSLG